MGLFFFISETTFCHRFVCFPRTKQWPHTLKKCSNGALVTTKTILNVIMTQFGIFGVIMVAVAHCFEIFYKINKNNILPTNFKNLKKFKISKISKMKFSDILLKLFPLSYMLFYWLKWLLLQLLWNFLSKKVIIKRVKNDATWAL